MWKGTEGGDQEVLINTLVNLKEEMYVCERGKVVLMVS